MTKKIPFIKLCQGNHIAHRFIIECNRHGNTINITPVPKKITHKELHQRIHNIANKNNYGIVINNDFSDVPDNVTITIHLLDTKRQLVRSFTTYNINKHHHSTPLSKLYYERDFELTKLEYYYYFDNGLHDAIYWVDNCYYNLLDTITHNACIEGTDQCTPDSDLNKKYLLKYKITPELYIKNFYRDSIIKLNIQQVIITTAPGQDTITKAFNYQTTCKDFDKTIINIKNQNGSYNPFELKSYLDNFTPRWFEYLKKDIGIYSIS